LGGTDEWEQKYPRFGGKAMIEISTPCCNSDLLVHRILWINNCEEPMIGRRDI
jgi:hypothetical protein